MMENKTRICLLGEDLDGISLSEVFRKWFGEAVLTKVESASDIDSSSDILVIGQNALSRLKFGEAVNSYVKNGGACWIWHQDESAKLDWLPWKLSDIKPELRYLKLHENHKPNYLTPWIADRSHPLWNSPNYIDEGRFVFWDMTVNGERFESSASHVLRQSGWNILGRFVNMHLPPEANAALFAEAEYGKGRFVWTQLFSPQSIWNPPLDMHYPEMLYIHESWRMFAENVLSYVKGKAEDKIFSATVEAIPWAARAGDAVRIEAKSDARIVDAELLSPDGSVEKIQIPSSGSIECKPLAGGTYRARITLEDSERRHAVAHTFFKISSRWTPFRFMTHIHFNQSTSPDSLGAIFGQARRLGIDGIILGVLWDTPDVAELLASVDHPAVRFFMGQEIHSGLTEVPLPEDCPPENPDYRRHCTTFRHSKCIEWSKEDWEPRNLENTHAAGALAIVAHPYMSRWWLKPQNGHRFEAVEFDRLDTTVWDEVLKTGELVTGVSGSDNLGHAWFAMRGTNIGWFDAPFDEENLFRVILAGRVTKMNTFPLPLQAVGSELWFDINGQIPGGVVCAVDKILLRIRVRSHLPVEQLFALKNGDRCGLLTNSRLKDEPDEKNFEKIIEEEINGDGFYRIEINHDKLYHPLCVSSLSNPVFFKKVSGPEGAAFYALNQIPARFDDDKKRFIAGACRIEKVSFDNEVWSIILEEPSEDGELHITWPEMKSANLDGEEQALAKDQNGNWVVCFSKGRHEARLSASCAEKLKSGKHA